jgi:plastocyanin
MTRTAAVILTILVLAVVGLGVVAFTPLGSGLRYASTPGAPYTGGPATDGTGGTNSTSNTYNTTYVSTTTVIQVPNPHPVTHTVTYNDSGFSPRVLYVRAGDSVAFFNDSSGSMWVASDPHPTHTDLPGFDELGSIGHGASWAYRFTAPGTWGYHNHASSTQTGTIVVQ